MKWNTCDECSPVVEKLLTLWVRSNNAGGLEAVRIQTTREHLARWLNDHRRKVHSRVATAGASN